MTEPSRVRAVAVTDDGHVVTIKRVKPGQEPYWVLPGGGIESSDPSPESALVREVREELGADITVSALLTITDASGAAEGIYLVRIGPIDTDARTGPEFSDPARGAYIPERIPLTPSGIAAITLLPPTVAELLTDHLTAGTDLFTLPDLRQRR